MSWTMSWETFKECATQIIAVSAEIGDDWQWKGDKECPGGAYIAKKAVRYMSSRTSEADDSHLLEDHSLVNEERDAETSQVTFSPQLNVYTWEYHILFSLSYGVPVLYFNVHTSEGKLLSVDALWKGVDYASDSLSHQKWEALSQQEHPILRRPFFQLHPCKTAELLMPHRDHSDNFVVTWLSSVGPVVGLNLHPHYGKLVSKQ